MVRGRGDALAGQRALCPWMAYDSDGMSMASARQSWEAKEQREAQEIAEFEAIERHLVEETAASQRE
ncbi:unnamed protein product [Hyaloperonospora brassicae]|uniref:Uncharacterized protein n=1 Tax=Hyaloperonospora brassicae TaxID=162125 RepID=A0AAV0TYF8_HYABA|nr:unnamed protein product [Hyaloperonospora brassicae]